MSVGTAADEALDWADEHIGKAIESLGRIVTERCWGHDEYKAEYAEIIEKVHRKLLKLRGKLNRRA